MEKWEPYTADNRKVMFFGDRPELQAVEQSEFFRFLQQGCESGRIPFRTLNAFDAENEFR
jgi:hypothetical protein